MFQVKLGGNWTEYSTGEDKILKRALLPQRQVSSPSPELHLRLQQDGADQ
jgi:hypothetical protein